VNGGNVLRNIKTDITQLRIEMVSSGSGELPLTTLKKEKRMQFWVSWEVVDFLTTTWNNFKISTKI
jgi:hypothetical protein